jgi:hypothetical protein
MRFSYDRAGNEVIIRSPLSFPTIRVTSRRPVSISERAFPGRRRQIRETLIVPARKAFVLIDNTEIEMLVESIQVGDRTYLSRTIKQVEESLADRSGAEKKADLPAARWTALGLVGTIATALITRDMAKTLSVQLAISSPCAQHRLGYRPRPE